MSKIEAVQALQYRVLATPAPHVGVVLEITIATPAGEQRLPAFWMPAENAKELAAALARQATKARTLS